MGWKLGTMGIVKHCIQLTWQDTRPINCTPYRAGLKALEFGKMEMDKMIRMNVIDLTQLEWASPVVISSVKDGYL